MLCSNLSVLLLPMLTRTSSASAVLCVYIYFFWCDFGFHSLSSANDAARLLRNVKQAEGNILHLLTSAFHAYLIKNDFPATATIHQVLHHSGFYSGSVKLWLTNPLPFTSLFPMCATQMIVDLRSYRERRIFAFAEVIMHRTHKRRYKHFINASSQISTDL